MSRDALPSGEAAHPYLRPGLSGSRGGAEPSASLGESFTIMSRNIMVHPPPSETSGSDFARLSRKIADAGLLGRRPGYYALRITVVAGLYVSG
jgi:hypothetical protein